MWCCDFGTGKQSKTNKKSVNKAVLNSTGRSIALLYYLQCVCSQCTIQKKIRSQSNDTDKKKQLRFIIEERKSLQIKTKNEITKAFCFVFVVVFFRLSSSSHSPASFNCLFSPKHRNAVPQWLSILCMFQLNVSLFLLPSTFSLCINRCSWSYC